MDPRIELDDTEAAPIEVTRPTIDPPPPTARWLAQADWETSGNTGLKLYLAEEPDIGDEFFYHGVRWRIIDYRDGWVARLLV